ncbi:MAG: GtrA family protein [Patescibacteria group bacterium]
MNISNIIAWIHAKKATFARYFFTGITGLVMDVGLLYVAKEYFGIRPVIALFGTQILVIAYVFFMNRHWSFKSTATSTHRQLAKFLVVLAGNYVVSIVFMYLGHDMLGIHYQIVRITTVALSVSWNFLLYNYWVYRD